jgi:4-hydroxy-3-polyprenylbenzoate decarboxylase
MLPDTRMKKYVLALTGASGLPYALSVFRNLAERSDASVHVIVSEAARKIMALESDVGPEFFSERGAAVYSEDDLEAPAASGSWIHHGMVVCPCSMASLAAIAQGLGNTLIHRAADVTLKERRTLILTPRETPLSEIHLRNMLAAARAGALVLPACPGFYHRPGSIRELVDSVAGRILDHLGIENEIFPRWKT